jgi:hypothetical protein
VSKEDLARAITSRDVVRRGLIAVFGVVEPVQSFRLAYGGGRPRFAADWRQRLVHYFYLFDPEFGFMHVRRPTWFPFTIQVYVNGHDWLACRLSPEVGGVTVAQRPGQQDPRHGPLLPGSQLGGAPWNRRRLQPAKAAPTECGPPRVDGAARASDLPRDLQGAPSLFQQLNGTLASLLQMLLAANGS